MSFANVLSTTAVKLRFSQWASMRNALTIVAGRRIETAIISRFSRAPYLSLRKHAWHRATGERFSRTRVPHVTHGRFRTYVFRVAFIEVINRSSTVGFPD
jgi:hypothetical protein